MLRWVDRYQRHGSLPEDGGLLSQSASFVASLDLMATDIAQWEAIARTGR